MAVWLLFFSLYLLSAISAADENNTTERLNSLELRLLEQQAELATLFDTIHSQNDTIQRQVEKVSELTNRLVNESLNSERLRIALEEAADEVAVAFTAYRNMGVKVYRENEPLVFNEVITNEGSGYNSATGVFTCPKEGLYIFFFSVKQSGFYAMYHGLDAKLNVRGRDQTAATVTTFHQDQHLQGFNVAVVRLAVGDDVWVWPQGAVDGDMAATSFSGVRLA